MLGSKVKKQGRIFKIVLYGSYARGGWVDDPVGGYKSQSRNRSSVQDVDGGSFDGLIGGHSR